MSGARCSRRKELPSRRDLVCRARHFVCNGKGELLSAGEGSCSRSRPRCSRDDRGFSCSGPLRTPAKSLWSRRGTGCSSAKLPCSPAKSCCSAAKTACSARGTVCSGCGPFGSSCLTSSSPHFSGFCSGRTALAGDPREFVPSRPLVRMRCRLHPAHAMDPAVEETTPSARRPSPSAGTVSPSRGVTFLWRDATSPRTNRRPPRRRKSPRSPRTLDQGDSVCTTVPALPS
jgi:hypothetical protein